MDKPVWLIVTRERGTFVVGRLASNPLDRTYVLDSPVLMTREGTKVTFSPIDMVVLDAVEPAHAALHGPIARVAEHFGWAFGKRVDGEVQSLPAPLRQRLSRMASRVAASLQGPW